MKWISVKDELPNDNNNNYDAYNCVLVLSSHNYSIALAQYLEDKWILHSDGVFADVGTVGIEIKDISHWMPFPEPPKE